MLISRKDAVELALTFPAAYEDYPFSDPNWTAMRRSDSKKGFAWIFEREGKIWINMKCDPAEAEFLRKVYPSVIPAYHMNKTHWNTVILDGSIPDEEIIRMMANSYELCAKK